MKNIVISGANQGIGYYVVRELLREGYNVTEQIKNRLHREIRQMDCGRT